MGWAIAFSTTAFAEAGVATGLGVMSSNPLKITGAQSGSPAIGGHLDFYGYLKFRLGSVDSLAFVPTLGITSWFLTGKTADDGSSVLRYHLGACFEKRVGSSTIFHVGPGIFWEKISGDGQAITMPNGAGTAVFYAPSSTSVSRVVYFDVGLAFELASDQRFFTDIQLLNILSTKRTINLILAFEKDLF